MKLNSILIVYLLPGFILLLISANVFAQDTASGSPFFQKALLNTRAIYHQSFGDQSALYNGSRYGEYLFKFKEGHPFFYSEEPVAGSVIYDGILYDSVMMRYDEITDVLVINDQANRIQLLSEKVAYFNLYNSNFIRLDKDSLSNNRAGSGFCNLLYKGKICLLKKQIKTIREVITAGLELQLIADEKDHYYIKKEDSLFQINRSKDLYKLFGARKKEVQKFIKSNGLSYRRNRQNMLTKATAYYDSLKN